jgi:glycosyltransferase involved in cell wall biosynthesis
MKRAGRQSSVLNVDTRAPESDAYIKVSGAFGLARELVCHAWNDWVLNVHTNGHNPKSWMIALACGMAGQFGPGATLTLHSGLAPAYIREGRCWRRQLVRLACVMYTRVTCVNEEIAGAVSELGIAREQIEIVPAFLPIETPKVQVPAGMESWMKEHAPLVTSTMFFRPEYGFELLMQAVARLHKTYPGMGVVVMGSGEDREQAAALVERSGLRDAVYLAGDLDHELCLALMARSDVFVRPTYRDGDSISVREAISLGLPVVASNVGTRPDGTRLFEAGDVNGLVAQLGDVLAGMGCEPAAAAVEGNRFESGECVSLGVSASLRKAEETRGNAGESGKPVEKVYESETT